MINIGRYARYSTFVLFYSVSAQDTDTGVLANISSSLSGASEFILGLYYLVGVALVLGGINKLKKLGHRTAFMNVDSGITGPAGQMAIGALLIFFPSFLESMNQTLWNDPSLGDAGALSFAEGDSSLLGKVKPLVNLIQFIGSIALLRGFLILTKATGQGAQPGTLSKGFVHIIGGVLAINIVQTVETLQATVS